MKNEQKDRTKLNDKLNEKIYKTKNTIFKNT